MTTRNLETHEIRRLVVERRRGSGIGLYGGYEPIARWLFREHGVIATTPWIAQVIKESGCK